MILEKFKNGSDLKSYLDEVNLDCMSDGREMTSSRLELLQAARYFALEASNAQPDEVSLLDRI